MRVTVTYFNDRFRRQEIVERSVSDLKQPTIQAIIDQIEGKFGTVLTVHHQHRVLHRSIARLSDFMK